MTTAKKSTSTAVAKWDEELARRAQIAAGMQDSVATGQFFGLKGGILTFNDSPLPNNEMGVIILEGVLENVYYEGKFDPEDPQSPICFAFGRDAGEMKPHELVFKDGNNQADVCANCEHNKFGSADVGRGKACRNTQRLAMISAGTFDNGKFKPFTEEDHFEKTNEVYMKLPVTSVKGYAAFVKQVAGALKRPPFGIFTKVKVVPDPKTQFKVTFEPLGLVPNELMETVLKRHDAAAAAIDFPYLPFEADEEPPKRGAKSTSRGKPAAKSNRRKY